MSQAKIPFIFANGETLSPKKLITNFQQIAKDVTDVQAQRYSYSSFVLNYDGITSATAAEQRTFRICAPLAYEIVGVEIQYYDGAASTVTLTSTATGFISTSLTTTASATTRAYIYKNQNCRVAASTNCDFILAVSAGTVETCKVIVHIRASRFATAPADYSPSDVPVIASGDTISAATLNTEFTEIETAVSADTANQQDLRIQVITRRSVVSPFPATDDTAVLPSSGRIIHSFDAYVVAALTNDFDVAINDETGSTIAGGTASANGTTSIAVKTVSVADTQTVDDPDDFNDDYQVVMSRSGAGVATIPLAYVVIYYT
jgi:hypothetical protein